jgi:hypothetical protein
MGGRANAATVASSQANTTMTVGSAANGTNNAAANGG